ncbi:MAG: hypothetical protein V4629_05755 [Pseudomonadota bacterium]
MVGSKALNKFLIEFDVEHSHENIRTKLNELALPFENIRRLSIIKKLKINFKKYNPARLVNERWEMDYDNLFDLVSRELN